MSISKQCLKFRLCRFARSYATLDFRAMFHVKPEPKPATLGMVGRARFQTIKATGRFMDMLDAQGIGYDTQVLGYGDGYAVYWSRYAERSDSADAR